MNLIMYRLKKYKKGWIVEYKKLVWFGLRYKWNHVTHYSGLEELPYYYDNPEAARDGALREIGEQIDFYFYFPNALSN